MTTFETILISCLAFACGAWTMAAIIAVVMVKEFLKYDS